MNQTTQPAAGERAPVTLYVGVFADGENASPMVAAVILDAPFLGRVERLRQIVAANDLAYATIWDDPAAWGSDDGWNIQVCELRVSESGWYYTGSPKHTDYAVGTRAVSHEDTARLITEAQTAGKAYALYECDEGELIEEGVLPAPDGGLEPVETVEVVLTYDLEGDLSEAVLLASRDEVTVDLDALAKAQATRLEVNYPRGDRYGVPEAATDRGGAAHVRALGFRLAPDFEVYAEDSGDDSATTFEVTVRLPVTAYARLVGGHA